MVWVVMTWDQGEGGVRSAGRIVRETIREGKGELLECDAMLRVQGRVERSRAGGVVVVGG